MPQLSGYANKIAVLTAIQRPQRQSLSDEGLGIRAFLLLGFVLDLAITENHFLIENPSIATIGGDQAVEHDFLAAANRTEDAILGFEAQFDWVR
jgi:hypothetical protein